MDAASKLEQELSIPLATVREWMNSHVLINRIPTDILSLIPTHLSSQKDRFHASFVCRHWRQVFLQHGTLWSQIFLEKGKVYVKTLLKRAKGSKLEIIVKSGIPDRITRKLSPHARRITHLKFENCNWRDICMFSEVNSGPLPLLRTLEIDATGRCRYPQPGQFIIVIPPEVTLFGGALDLEQLFLSLKGQHFLAHLFFPNLTTLELSIIQHERFDIPDLLNFLKASPMLQTVKVVISAKDLGSAPQEMVVTLPNVKTFSLSVSDYEEIQIHDIAVHISCPGARHISLTQEMEAEAMRTGLKVFPTSLSWKGIVRQCLTNPTEEVTLEMSCAELEGPTCSLTFSSSGTTAFVFGFRVSECLAFEDSLDMTFEEMYCGVFCQAIRTIRDHPLLSHFKRLHIKHGSAVSDADLLQQMASEVGRLFKSVGPLDELIIGHCDLLVFLPPFLDPQGLDIVEGQSAFPAVKSLTILGLITPIRDREILRAFEELARSQYQLGIPFERVTLSQCHVSGMEERLGRWGCEVSCPLGWLAGGYY